MHAVVACLSREAAAGACGELRHAVLPLGSGLIIKQGRCAGTRCWKGWSRADCRALEDVPAPARSRMGWDGVHHPRLPSDPRARLCLESCGASVIHRFTLMMPRAPRPRRLFGLRQNRAWRPPLPESPCEPRLSLVAPHFCGPCNKKTEPTSRSSLVYLAESANRAPMRQGRGGRTDARA